MYNKKCVNNAEKCYFYLEYYDNNQKITTSFDRSHHMIIFES